MSVCLYIQSVHSPISYCALPVYLFIYLSIKLFTSSFPLLHPLPLFLFMYLLLLYFTGLVSCIVFIIYLFVFIILFPSSLFLLHMKSLFLFSYLYLLYFTSPILRTSLFGIYLSLSLLHCLFTMSLLSFSCLYFTLLFHVLSLLFTIYLHLLYVAAFCSMESEIPPHCLTLRQPKVSSGRQPKKPRTFQ